MAGLTPLDFAVILFYLAGITYIGLRASKSVKDIGDFFMGGRRFGKLLMVAKAFSVGTRADQAVAVTGASYQVGLSGVWYQWLYIFSTPFYWIIAPIYRRLRYLTTGDFFEQRYGKAAGALYTFVALLFFSVEIGMVLRGTGTTVEALTKGQIPANLTILVATMIFVSYSAAGGLVAAVKTKLLQGTMLVILSLLLLPFAFREVGGFSGLHQRLAPEMFSLVAKFEVTLFFITMVTINALVGVVAMPHHTAIGGAGKSEISCRTGWTYGNIVKRFVTLFWAFTGLFALALYPGLAEAEREQAFGMMILNLLPAGLVGLMIAAMVASLMAVCDAYMIDGSALFTRNFYRKFFGANLSEDHEMKVARWSSILVVGAGILFALVLSDVVSGLKFIWKIMAFMGIPFWMAIFWRRGNRYGLWVSVIVTSMLSFYTQSRGWPIEDQIAVYLPAGVLAFIIASLLSKPEPEEKLRAFYTLLHTPVGEEYKLRHAGIEIIHQGGSDAELAASKSDFAPAPTESLEEKGHALLLVDLLHLPKTFSFKRYRIDILGFIAAWGLVVGIILVAVLLARIGT
jgi:Na+/proline symporter